MPLIKWEIVRDFMRKASKINYWVIKNYKFRYLMTKWQIACYSESINVILKAINI